MTANKQKKTRTKPTTTAATTTQQQTETKHNKQMMPGFNYCWHAQHSTAPAECCFIIA